MRTTSCWMTLQVLEIVPAECLVLVLCVSSFAHDEKNSTHLHSDVSGSIDHTQLPENLNAREGFWRTLMLGSHVAP